MSEDLTYVRRGNSGSTAPIPDRFFHTTWTVVEMAVYFNIVTDDYGSSFASLCAAYRDVTPEDIQSALDRLLTLDLIAEVELPYYEAGYAAVGVEFDETSNIAPGVIA